MLTPTLKKILSCADLKTQIQIGRQFIRSKKENKSAEGFTDDPMGERAIADGHSSEFIHKYPDKILVIASDKCPILCRFCTRKRITYRDYRNDTAPRKYARIVHYIQSHKEIQEVIFSGGDPFMLSNEKIKELIHIFLNLSQVKKIRFHSRTLTILPERFNIELFEILSQALAKHPSKQATLVVHINHAAEISDQALTKIQEFKQAGIHVLCQTVLLRHVNDSVELLRQLFEKLVRHGIKPYYIHQLDRVTGSSHFEVSLDKGIEIMKTLRKTIPQCIIPAFVMDGPEGKKRIM